jgi:hypothetical protein
MTNPIDDELAVRIMLAALFFDLDLDGRIEDGEAPNELTELPALPDPSPHRLAA